MLIIKKVKPKMFENIIETKELSKEYSKNVFAVNNINLKIARGEFFSILGPSGCGKTTLLHLIAGHLKPTRGQIFINNINMTDQLAENRPVNTVFQTFSLFPHLNVFENVAFGLKIKKVDKYIIKEEVQKILEIVNLSSFAERNPKNLSGGEQQRVALARALIIKPIHFMTNDHSH